MALTPQDGDAPNPLSTRARIRVALSQALRNQVEAERGLISTAGDQEMRAGEFIIAWRRLLAQMQAMGEVVVALEMVSGANWEQITVALGQHLREDGMQWVRSTYQEKVERMVAGESAPLGPRVPGHTVTGLPDTPDEVDWAMILDLESWFIRTVDPADRPTLRPHAPDPADSPIVAGLY